MKVSANGTAVIAHWESCRLKAYPDPKTGGAPWTVGFGATGAGIGPGVVWTQAEADTRLARDIVEREDDANECLRTVVSQGQFDAFVSILFNVGHGSPARDGIVRLRSGYPSTLLRKINAGDPTAREEFARWVSPGSNVERGLRRRRASEMALWDGKTGAEAIAIGENFK